MARAMKLHLGCGRRHIPGWYHVDLTHHEHVDLIHSVDHLPQVPDESASVVYACHVLEHFPRARVPRVLDEWRRVLMPGGVLRVAVPDFFQWARRYVATGDLGEVHGSVIGGQKDRYDFHGMLFDEPTLAALLKAAGFRDVRYYDWRETEHADVDDLSQTYLPHMDKKNGQLMSLNMEGTK